LAPVDRFDPGLEDGVGAERQHAAEVGRQMHGDGPVAGEPGRRTHRLVEHGGDAPAVRVPRGTESARPEPGLADETALGVREVAHPEALSLRLARDERAPAALDAEGADRAPTGPGPGRPSGP